MPKKKTPRSTTKASPKQSSFPIVGIGASAGGLEALEQFFKAVPPDAGMGFVVVRRMIHELRTHQIELEMQNEELRLAQAELVAARGRLSNLYDFAPVGYLTVSRTGQILEANLKLAEMLGVNRRDLLKKRLSAFIVPDDEDVYFSHRKETLDSQLPGRCELRIKRNGAGPLWVELESRFFAADGEAEATLRSVVSDTSKRKEAEQRFEASNPRFRTVADFAYDWEWWQSPDEQFLHVSPSSARVTGYEPQEFIDRPALFHEILLPEDKELWEKHAAASRQVRGTNEVQFRIRRADGEVRWIGQCRQAVTGEDGTFLGFRASNRDITEHKLVEQALRASEALKTRILETALDAVILADEAGRVNDWNRQAEVLFGWTKEEAIDKVLVEDLIPIRHRDAFQRGMRVLLTTGEGPFLEKLVETEALRRDGSEFPVELTVTETRVGETRTFCAFVRDTSDRKKALHQISESEARWRSITENAPDFMLTLDADLRIRLANRAAPGFSVHDLIGQPLPSLAGPADCERVQELLEGVLRTRQPVSYETEFQTEDGTTIHFESRAAPRVEDGLVTGLTIQARDITDQKSAEAALRETHERIMLQRATLFDLATSDPVQRGDLVETFRQTTEAAARLLDVERVSVWELDETGSKLLSSDFFDASLNRHSKAPALAVAEYPTYMAAIADHPVVDAHDAREDSRTSEFSASYLEPNGISSVLNAGIRVTGRLVGIVCHERMGEKRKWTPDESTFARALADLLGRAMQQRDRIDDQRTLQHALKTITELQERFEAENVYLKEKVALAGEYEDPIGKSSVWVGVTRRTEQVAQTDASVLILGETGTGKDTIAQFIHRRSRRREQPFVHVSCTTLPESLVESELFGHERGAFTGAIQRRLGRFEIADGGTLFLDEVGDLPLGLQLKLLRVLERGEFERVGSTKTQRVDVRLLAATNRDLEKEAAAGLFREDLYYRLSVFPVWLPPLRERVDDIPLLTWYFVNKLRTKLSRSLDIIPQHVFDKLKSYRWPGNVRELENVIERAMILSTGTALQLDESILGGGRRVSPILGTQLQLDGVQRDHIVAVLEGCDWKIKGKGNAAELLGLNPSTLYARMKKLGIKRPHPA